MKKPSKYQSLCYDCGSKLYRRLRHAGGITVSLKKCPKCGEKKGIIPASDWYYMCEPIVTSEDWD